MEMNFIVKPSLQQMALFKIAAQLWNQKDIRILIDDYNRYKANNDFKTKWQEVEEEVVKHVPHLLLPALFKKVLKGLIRPIGRQIRAWCRYHHQCREWRKLSLPKQFSWTPEGTIDRKRTAEAMVKHEKLDRNTTYQLSFIYCLEDQLSVQWNRFPTQKRQSIYLLVEFWTYRLIGDKSILNEVMLRRQGYPYYSPNECALRCAMENGNKTAIEFFYRKLSGHRKLSLWVGLAECALTNCYYANKRRECYSEVLYYFLSRMTKHQKVQLLLKFPFEMLSCFLHWPFQPFFMDSAERVVHLIDDDQYNRLVDSIISKILERWTDIDYRQLFHGFWNLIPRCQQTYAKLCTHDILIRLFKAGERDVIETIFEDVPCENRDKLRGGILELLIRQERWEAVKFLHELCGPMKEVLDEEVERGSGERVMRANMMMRVMI